MENLNLLIFTVYIIIVVYVFYKAYQSLESQVTIDPNYDVINKELELNGLKEVVEISFKKLRRSYQINQLKTLMIGIRNKSENSFIRVNWDESSITDFDGITGRLIRVTRGLTEIPQKQVVSVAVPGQKLEEEISDDKDIAGLLFKPAKLRKATLKGNPFYLGLSLKIAELGGVERSYFLRCEMMPRKLRWTKALAIALTPPPKKKSK